MFLSVLQSPSQAAGRRRWWLAAAVLALAAGGGAFALAPFDRTRSEKTAPTPEGGNPGDDVEPFELEPIDLGIRPRVDWSPNVSKRLQTLIPAGAEVGLYVEDLRSGKVFTWDADRPMYLGSAIKIFVMMEAHRQRENGDLSFDEQIWYRRSDVRDGAPSMNKLRRNQRYPISELMLYMMRDSDNAATDLLFGRIGADAVEGMMHDLDAPSPGGVVPMLDVRRAVYRTLDPRADRLDAVQVRDVRWRNGFYPRLDILKKHIGPPAKDFDRTDLDNAYRDYYRQFRNSISMRQAGMVMGKLFRGEIVSSAASEEMLRSLKEVWSSGHRLRGVVDDDTVVAHKTGTQHKRICDLAVVWLDDGPIVVAVAVAHLPRLKAEAVLRAVVGAVIGATGSALQPDVAKAVRRSDAAVRPPPPID